MRLHCGAARATCLSKVELVCVGADVRLVKHDVVFALHHTTTGMRAAGIHLEGAGAAPQQNEELGGEGWQQMAGLGGHHPPGLCPQQARPSHPPPTHLACATPPPPTWPVPAADMVPPPPGTHLACARSRHGCTCGRARPADRGLGGRRGGGQAGGTGFLYWGRRRGILILTLLLLHHSPCRRGGTLLLLLLLHNST